MKNRKSRSFVIRCKDCFWFDACVARAEQGVDPDQCTEYKYKEPVIKRPNFWFYLAGDLAFGCLAALAAWLGLKYDSAAGFFLAGAASVWVSNLDCEYHHRLHEYNRYLREVRQDG